MLKKKSEIKLELSEGSLSYRVSERGLGEGWDWGTVGVVAQGASVSESMSTYSTTRLFD